MHAEAGAGGASPSGSSSQKQVAGRCSRGVVYARVLSQSRALKGSCTEVESRVQVIQMPRF